MSDILNEAETGVIKIRRKNVYEYITREMRFFFDILVYNSAWSGLPEPENPTGLEQFSKSEPKWNPIWYNPLYPNEPEPEYFQSSQTREKPEPEAKTRGYP